MKAFPAEKTMWPKAWRLAWALDTRTGSCGQAGHFRSLPASDRSAQTVPAGSYRELHPGQQGHPSARPSCPQLHLHFVSSESAEEPTTFVSQESHSSKTPQPQP